MNKILKKRLYRKRSEKDAPDWDRITFKDEIPRPWERGEEERMALSRRVVEIKIPLDLLKTAGPGHFPLKRIWRWARKKYPSARLFFRGYKLFMRRGQDE